MARRRRKTSASPARLPLLVVSYYTEGTGYEQEVEGHVESLRAVGLASHVEAVPDRGDWFANSAYRAAYMLQMLKRFGKANRILWLDIDARAKRYPTELDGLDCDLAACWINGGICGGTVYLQDSERTRAFLEALWDRHQNGEAVEKTDQNTGPLVRAFEAADKLRVEWLPPEYAHISGCHPELSAPVVFLHDMASFRYCSDRRHRQRVMGRATA